MATAITRGSGLSRRDRNRAVRQEAFRELLAKQGHLQHAVVLIEQIKDLSVALEPIEAKRLEIALQGHLKLVSLYIPAAKEVGELFESLGKTFVLNMDGVRDPAPEVPALPAPATDG